jgi:hypothetical protein
MASRGGSSITDDFFDAVVDRHGTGVGLYGEPPGPDAKIFAVRPEFSMAAAEWVASGPSFWGWPRSPLQHW